MRATSSRGGKRLGQVIVGTRIKTGDLVLLLSACRQHDDRQFTRPVFTAQPPRKLDAVHAGKHPVEQHHVGQGPVHQRDGFFSGIGAHHAMPGMLKGRGNQFLDSGFVFNN